LENLVRDILNQKTVNYKEILPDPNVMTLPKKVKVISMIIRSDEQGKPRVSNAFIDGYYAYAIKKVNKGQDWPPIFDFADSLKITDPTKRDPDLTVTHTQLVPKPEVNALQPELKHCAVQMVITE